MKRGFYTIMAAQFFSSLADAALLFVAIDLLVTMKSPGWITPLLKLSFVLFYVLLAAFVGAFADAFPKGRVMFIANLIKILGCSLIFFHVHPLLAYALVGFGAAVYSPAKYGILTELLPAEKLVAANAWIEGLTVASIIFGTVLGGTLVSARASAFLLAFDLPLIDTGIANCYSMLWKDKLGQISLAVTTLFWGAAQTLQFIVLEWAKKSLQLPYDKATSLVGVVAVGVAIGAVLSACFISLRKSLTVIPLGIAMGVIVMGMTLVHSVYIAAPLLVVVGLLSGFFLVPMNALLQHRGHVLMSAGHSIAVQNFNENLSILTMLAVYSIMLRLHLNLDVIIVLFGLFVAGTMFFIMRKHAANQKEHDSLNLIGELKH